jgi:hypothetical protein
MKQDNWSNLRVCAERCEECLFSKDRIVDGERAAQLLRETIAKGIAFECHKHSFRYMHHECSRSEAAVMCRGYFDHPATQGTMIIRLAHRLNNIVFVDFEGREVQS